MIAKIANVCVSAFGAKKMFLELETLELAFNKVRTELAAMDILHKGSKLDRVNCYLIFCPRNVFNRDEWSCYFAEGFCDDGIIYVPNVDWMVFDGNHRILLDVLRHEFGHALADKYGKFFRGGIFKEAFGKSYGTGRIFDGDDWAAEHVSSYATTDTREDFAETFMLYMKYKGKMPARFRGKRAIVKKWKAVGQIIREIAALGK